VNITRHFSFLLLSGLLSAFAAKSTLAGDIDLKYSGKPIYIQSDEIEDDRKKDSWSGRLGLGVQMAPDFLGSSNHSITDALDFKGSYKDLIFIENNKIGSVLYKHRMLRAGIIGRASLGRRDDLVLADLSGLPDVNEAFEVGAFAATSLYKLFVAGEVYWDVSSVHGGASAEIEAGYTYEFNSNLTVTPVVGAVWGSSDYMQAHFGVDDNSGSGFEAYNASAGFYEYFLEFAAEQRLSKKWLVKTSLRFSDLVGSAAKSPIVRSESGDTNQLSAFFAVVWLF
jgi:outer membrane protein